MDLRRKERGASEGTLFVVKKWLSGGVGLNIRHSATLPIRVYDLAFVV